jgi:hypothetical protein
VLVNIVGLGAMVALGLLLEGKSVPYRIALAKPVETGGAT